MVGFAILTLKLERIYPKWGLFITMKKVNLKTKMNIPDIIKEFDGLFGTIKHRGFPQTAIKAFIAVSLTSLLNEIVVEVEGKQRSHEEVGAAPRDYAVGSENRAFGFNSALREVAQLIKAKIQ